MFVWFLVFSKALGYFLSDKSIQKAIKYELELKNLSLLLQNANVCHVGINK